MVTRRVSVQNRVACAALAIANTGAGMWVAGDPAPIGGDVFVTVLAVAGVVLALPAAVTALTGWIGRAADEGLFVNGVYWAFITVLFSLSHHGGWGPWGLSVILLGGTVAAFSLWIGIGGRR